MTQMDLYNTSDQFVLLSPAEACARCNQFERPCLWTISMRQTRCHSCGNQSCTLTDVESSEMARRVIKSLSGSIDKLALEVDEGEDEDRQEAIKSAALAMEGVMEELEI
jgi:hypothetical protein